jgi:hypothetical protein
MPVALPPTGRYPIRLEPAGTDRGLDGAVEIDAAGRIWIHVPDVQLGAADRLRVTFAPGGRLPDQEVAATIRRS